jgi:hypothetical protein
VLEPGNGEEDAVAIERLMKGERRSGERTLAHARA